MSFCFLQIMDLAWTVAQSKAGIKEQMTKCMCADMTTPKNKVITMMIFGIMLRFRGSCENKMHQNADLL